MTRNSVQPRHQIFVKSCRFCLLLEIWVRVSHKNLSRKSSQKLRDRAKQSTTDAIKTD